MNRSLVLSLAALLSIGSGACAAGGTTGDTGTGTPAGANDAGPGGDGATTGDGAIPVFDGSQGCTPQSCAKLGANCGAVDDGCGTLIDCGTCPNGQQCGASKPNVCGFECTPRTCAQLGASCGVQGDGCGGLLDCGSCQSGETCGGAGVHNACGAAGSCKPKTCSDLGANCGFAGDGCGGLLDCGSCTTPGEVCGAHAPNLCGGAVQSCVPKTCADLGANCGFAGDGCGGVTQNCGSCTVPGEVCGGGGVPNVCGGAPPACVPKTCTDLGANCGYVGDGCGNVVFCGTCGTNEVCGAVTPSVCAATTPPCVPKTCTDLGANCGPVPDGCGGVIASCGTCTAPQTCSGVPGKPYQCGCTGVCADVPTCTGGTTTTLTGIVKDPAGNTPLSHVLVYVPNDPQDPDLQSFPATLTCDQCGANAAGNPLVSTYTANTGTFSLDGVPVGSDVMVVIQVGRWRRLFHVAIPNACQKNVATGTGQGGTTIQGGVLTMPRNKSQGNIPFTSVVTALGDNIECVLLKMGIDQAEFTNPGGGGRVELYTSAGYGPYDVQLGGAFINYSTPDSYALVNNLNKYDQVLLPCPGTASVTGDPLLTNYGKLVDYANAGGRLFATHYAYIYLQKGGAANPFYGTALWSSDHSYTLSATATVDTNPADNPKGQDFADWLHTIGALATVTPPTFTVTEARHDVSSVVSPTQQWLTFVPSGQSSSAPLHFAFNAPVGASGSQQCGRVVFSDLHVVQSPSSATWFPDECSTAPMTAQEKVLEYMLFDLASCVQPYTPGCSPSTCADQGIECGAATDGCGNVLDCGGCAAGETCGGGGVPGKCGSATCTPKTCPQLGWECGSTGDGCGNVLSCGDCQAAATCGGGGVPGQCGQVTCTPKTCGDQGIACGQAGDGCGGVLSCGDCTSPETCGGGTPGVCGVLTCTPSDCGTRCGKQGDGCGGILDCPACDGGAGGCEPITCAAFGAQCGKIGDGCGGVVDCGACPSGTYCGGGGVAYKCGGVQ